MRLFRFRATLFAMLLVAACETAPPAPHPTAPLPSAMTESSFNASLASAKAYRNPFQAERQLSAILARGDLNTDMRARALYERGSLRRQGASNKQGAVKDFGDMLRLAPSHSWARNARIEQGYAQNYIRQLEQYRRTGRLQTIAAWFEDAWVMGEHDKAVARYQRSGLSPTAGQITQLTDAGYLCKGNGAGGKLYKFGPMRGDLQNVYWCRGANS